MLQASGDPRMARRADLDLRLDLQRDRCEQVLAHGNCDGDPAGADPAVPPLADDFTAGRRYGACGGYGADAVTRIALLLLAAGLTATATMTIGPLSFVGLMAPHIARMMGFRRAMPHMRDFGAGGGCAAGRSLTGAGRMVLFPYPDPGRITVDVYLARRTLSICYVSRVAEVNLFHLGCVAIRQ